MGALVPEALAAAERLDAMGHPTDAGQRRALQRLADAEAAGGHLAVTGGPDGPSDGVDR
jgi:hypothetical protein